MKTLYSNTCIGCDLIKSNDCSHLPKNKYPGSFKNKPKIIDQNICIIKDFKNFTLKKIK